MSQRKAKHGFTIISRRIIITKRATLSKNDVFKSAFLIN
nr:MAG TPA: hypothetical protein [Caudoviricetes sp.]